MTSSLHWLDWLVVIAFTGGIMAIGFYFTRRAGKNIESYFISGRSIKWYVAGSAMVASTFAADTPLWVCSLVRQYGVYYIWQHWCQFIGYSLAIVLFARLWRRMSVVTDIEFLEMRYTGKAAKTLRFWEGSTKALISCPLIIGWVTKAMETITRESMGIPPEYSLWTTALVVGFSIMMCTFAGQWGVTYTGALQFVVATIGTVMLAVMAVNYVGGLDVMVSKLSAGNTLKMLPQIGNGADQMSAWNVVGYFGILWFYNGLCPEFTAQRILSCKDTRHSSFMMLMYSIVSGGLIIWPWIIVGLCSIIVLPNLGVGVSHDAAYPRMIMTVLPIGLRGVLVAALLAAFISTITSLFNWGSSYFVNDVYKRFLVPDASDSHYIVTARLATVFIGVTGALISFFAKDIQQLLTINYVILSGTAVIGIMRWLWYRMTPIGDLAGIITAWVLAFLILFARAFDGPARFVLGLDAETKFSSDPNLLGARMLFVILMVVLVVVIVSLFTKQTNQKHLREFVSKARPPRLFWNKIVRQLDYENYKCEEVGKTLLNWLITAICIFSFIFGVGKLLLGSPKLGLVCLSVFAITLYVTIRQINADFIRNDSEQEKN